MLYDAYRGEDIKSQVFLSGINGSKRVARMWKAMEEVVQDLTEPTTVLKKQQNTMHSVRRLNVSAMFVQLTVRKGTVKRPELRSKEWSLDHDNAPAHKALSVKQFLIQKCITAMEHHPVLFIWLLMTSGCSKKNK
jgi:hypothetical protein